MTRDERQRASWPADYEPLLPPGWKIIEKPDAASAARSRLLCVRLNDIHGVEHGSAGSNQLIVEVVIHTTHGGVLGGCAVTYRVTRGDDGYVVSWMQSSDP